MVHNLTALSFAVYWLRILWHLYSVFLLSHMFVISVYFSYSIQSCKVTVIVLWPDCHKSYWTQWCWKYQEKPEISCSTIWFGGSGRKQHCLYTYYIYIIFIPRTQLTSIFEGQPSKTRPFSIKTGVIWVLGTYIYNLCVCHICVSKSVTVRVYVQ